MKFLTVNFNTQKFVDALIRSINMFHNNAEIIVFDNSNKESFRNTHSNVIVLDNTKGQIIDFKKELSKYDLINEDTHNDFGSLKHCLTIDKCINLINDDFILLDSDILLKRNVSDIWDKKYCSVGQINDDSNAWKARILPFINFINVEMCKKYNINYFNGKKIFGVKHNKPYYDTGASFLEEMRRKNLPIRTISTNDYIVHYGAGSYRQDKNIDEWLNRYKDLHTYKTIIYTCITGGYDTPYDGFEKKKGYRYVLISDRPIQTQSWENIICKFDGKVNLTDVKKQRFVKLHPYKFLDKDTLTVWIDGNLPINDKLYDYIEKNRNHDITFKKHTCHKCIYQECDAVMRLGKDTIENVNRIKERYKKENVPYNLGMLETNIIIRKDKEWVRNLMNVWWGEIRDNSHRDQLSIIYVLWKYNLKNKVHIAISKDFAPRPHTRMNYNISTNTYGNPITDETIKTKQDISTTSIRLSNGMRIATPKRNIDIYNKRSMNKPRRIKNIYS